MLNTAGVETRGEHVALTLETLWVDSERRFCQTWQAAANGPGRHCLAILPASALQPEQLSERLRHEYALRDLLDDTWAVRPISLLEEEEQALLLCDYREAQPLERLLGVSMDLRRFLRLAISVSNSLARLHEAGLAHKDIKPSNILVAPDDDQIWFTGFGIASRLPRERQAPDPPELIAGTLSHMAPEQTGRMNRSIDSRCDLYSLGVTFYQALTGRLPFAASDAMEWVHCHLARLPVPPHKAVAGVPAQVSAIVMRLLAKTPEERYQTASGLERDLRHCLQALDSRQAIDEFPLGESDRSSRLAVPERLYGRDAEIEVMLTAFNETATRGACRLMLVRGNAGVGKSSVVNELHKALVPKNGLFASGKFDRLQGNVPYGPVTQALRGLVHMLLKRPDDERAASRRSLEGALGSDAPLAVDLIPELASIMGKQPQVPEMEAGAAKLRWQRTLCRLIGTFARIEHPLVLFLDDLQWLDGETLDLLEAALLDPDLRNLLLIGAYRGEEVDSSHALARKLEAIRMAGASATEISLDPLAVRDLVDLVSDMTRCEPARVQPLAQLIFDRTAGNPLAVKQFIQTLAEEELILFDRSEEAWSWEMPSIRDTEVSKNIVDLVLHKLQRLPAPTRRALEELACLGHRASASTLAIAHGSSEEALHDDLWEALRRDLIAHSAEGYRFVHDRIQEAAYGRMPHAARTLAHLRIGRSLAASLGDDDRNEALFDVVGQLNRGAALMRADAERSELVDLNLTAARRAMSTGAHASARAYLESAAGVAAAGDWAPSPDKTFELELRRGECEFHTGELAQATSRLETLLARAVGLSQRATVAGLLATVNWGAQRPAQGVAACMACLKEAGLDIPLAPTDAEARATFERLRARLRSRSIETLEHLPAMSDPSALQQMELLAKVLPSALAVNFNLCAILALLGVDLSLDHGNCDASCYVYEYVGLAASILDGDFDTGYRFGRLGADLANARFRRFQPTVAAFFAAVIAPWSQPAALCLTLIRDSIAVAKQECDLITFVGTAATEFIILMLNGDPLAEVEACCDRAVHITRRAGFPDYIQAAKIHAALARNLRGRMPRFGWLDDPCCSEADIERHFAEEPHVPIYECWYWICKLQARYFAGEIPEALDATQKAQPLAWMCGTLLQSAELAFYGALVHAAAWTNASADDRATHIEAMRTYLAQLDARARHCPENFGCRATLVAAELARVEGRNVAAAALYGAAVEQARDSGFQHTEALVNELAAGFHVSRGATVQAQEHLRAARRGYQQWGAEGKVRQLDAKHGESDGAPRAVDTNRTLQTSVEQLDLSVVLKVLEAVSGETDLDRLIATVVRLALEQAGAARGLLILPYGADFRIEAEASARDDGFEVALRRDDITSAELPRTVLQQVLRSRTSVLLQDASEDHPLADDEYLRARRARSVVCIPLLKQARLVGVLYLENPHVSHTFTANRLALLKLLASEAAISLENARLYHDLREREARVRRLVDSNIIGIVLWHRDGRIVEANDAFVRMVGYQREDFIAGRVRWADLSPPDWLHEDIRAMETVRVHGAVQAFEREVLRKDGQRVPVLVGAASFEGTTDEGVGYFLDLTESKRAEQVAREGERRNHELQMRLADANRIASIGQLAAAIAHEINQPLAGIITNASTGTRMLAVDPVDLRSIGDTIRRTLRDAERASEVIRRLRSLFTGQASISESVELNAISESVAAMLASDLRREQIDLTLELAHMLPRVVGDPIQLQQVILNMLRNAAQAMQGKDAGVREIVLRTQLEDGDRVRLSVTDNGQGFDPASQGRLFEAFYTTKANGMGIGLSVSRSIVERHQGRLWAEANSGPGATFAFSLPVSNGPEPALDQRTP